MTVKGWDETTARRTAGCERHKSPLTMNYFVTVRRVANHRSPVYCINYYCFIIVYGATGRFRFVGLIALCCNMIIAIAIKRVL